MAAASERIRILVTGLPRMLHEIVESAIADELDMELVTTCQSRPVLLDALTSDVDVVILGLDHSRTGLVLLEARPRMTVVGIIGDGREAILYKTRPERSSLRELSPHSLVTAIRAAARSAWTYQATAEAVEESTDRSTGGGDYSA